MSDADVIITIVGLGGGTGTAVAPIIDSIARSKKTMKICFASQSLDEVGQYQIDSVKQGIYELIKIQLQMLKSKSLV